MCVCVFGCGDVLLRTRRTSSATTLKMSLLFFLSPSLFSPPILLAWFKLDEARAWANLGVTLVVGFFFAFFFFLFSHARQSKDRGNERINWSATATAAASVNREAAAIAAASASHRGCMSILPPAIIICSHIIVIPYSASVRLCSAVPVYHWLSGENHTGRQTDRQAYCQFAGCLLNRKKQQLLLSPPPTSMMTKTTSSLLLTLFSLLLQQLWLHHRPEVKPNHRGNSAPFRKPSPRESES